MELINLASSAAGGGVLGLLGSLTTGVFGYFKRKAELKREREQLELMHRQELELREADISYMKAEADLALQRDALELEGQQLGADVERFQATIAQDTAAIDHGGHWLLILAEFIRKIFRPVLTSLLFFLVYHVYQDAPEAMKAEIIQGVLGMAAAAGAWWFTDRTQIKQGGR